MSCGVSAQLSDRPWTVWMGGLGERERMDGVVQSICGSTTNKLQQKICLPFLNQ